MNMGLLSGSSSSSSSSSAHYLPVTMGLEASHTGSKAWALRASRIALGATYALVAALAAVVIWQLSVRSAERHVVAWSVAAIFVGIAVPLSVYEVHMHLVHFESPRLQVAYCRIILMVPIFAVESWLALRFKEQALLLAVARELWEALVIRDFFRLLLDALSRSTGDASVVAAKFRAQGKREAHMLFPLSWSTPWRLDTPEFVRRTQICVFQYVVVRVVMSVAVFISASVGTFGEGEWTDFSKLFVWSVLIVNASQMVAMYGLVLFFHETAEMLGPLRPLSKFIAVKAVVFLSFWQSILISGLVELKVITATADYTEDEVASGLQNFLICAEMAGAAVAHHYVFSVDDILLGRHLQGAMAGSAGGAAVSVADASTRGGLGGSAGAMAAAGAGAGMGAGAGAGAGGRGVVVEWAGHGSDGAVSHHNPAMTPWDSSPAAAAMQAGGATPSRGGKGAADAPGSHASSYSSSSSGAGAAATALAAAASPAGGGTNTYAAAAQLLPHDVLAEAGQHAQALRIAAAETMAATVQQGRGVFRGLVAGGGGGGAAGGPAWATSSDGSAAAAGGVATSAAPTGPYDPSPPFVPSSALVGAAGGAAPAGGGSRPLFAGSGEADDGRAAGSGTDGVLLLDAAE